MALQPSLPLSGQGRIDTPTPQQQAAQIEAQRQLDYKGPGMFTVADTFQQPTPPEQGRINVPSSYAQFAARAKNEEQQRQLNYKGPGMFTVSDTFVQPTENPQNQRAYELQQSFGFPDKAAQTYAKLMTNYQKQADAFYKKYGTDTTAMQRDPAYGKFQFQTQSLNNRIEADKKRYGKYANKEAGTPQNVNQILWNLESAAQRPIK